MNPNKKIKLPDSMWILKDPHHNGCVEWAYYQNEFYNRSVNTLRWQKVWKPHLTEARFLMLVRLFANTKRGKKLIEAILSEDRKGRSQKQHNPSTKEEQT